MSMRLAVRVWELDLPQNLAWLLFALADSADDTTAICQPSQDHLAWKCSCDVKTVRRNLTTLEEQAIIETIKAGRGRGNYTIFRLHLERAPMKRPWAEVKAELQATGKYKGQWPGARNGAEASGSAEIKGGVLPPLPQIKGDETPPFSPTKGGVGDHKRGRLAPVKGGVSSLKGGVSSRQGPVYPHSSRANGPLNVNDPLTDPNINGNGPLRRAAPPIGGLKGNDEGSIPSASALGLEHSDQAAWLGIVQQRPPLPGQYRRAYFKAPDDLTGKGGVIIFRDEADCTIAQGAAHRSELRTLTKRLRERYPRLAMADIGMTTIEEWTNVQEREAGRGEPAGAPE